MKALRLAWKIIKLVIILIILYDETYHHWREWTYQEDEEEIAEVVRT